MTRGQIVRNAALIAAVAVAPGIASAACASSCRPDGVQASGAIYRICMPQPASCGNGDLVIYAHGYVDAYKPVAIPEDQLILPDGTSVPGIVNAIGYSFATTSYRRNGLAVVEGIQDIRDLVEVYKRDVGTPGRIFLVGPSEGGIITAKMIEMYPHVFTGGLAACGAVGSFSRQINYIGDFRVLFNYLFPGVIPGQATVVPQFVIDNWDSVYVPRIKNAIKENPATAAELIRVARVPIGGSAANIEDAIISVAWYAVFATNDARQQLGGQPFDNIGRWYSGSSNDVRLNLMVERAAASPAALAAMQNKYETTGLLAKPLITLHTTGDQILPYWHEPLYRAKAEASGSGNLHLNVPVFRYGHCNLNAGEVLFGFALLVLKSTRQEITGLRPTPPSIVDTRTAAAQ